MFVLHPHGVGGDIVEADRAVPRGHQEELGRAGAELDSGDGVLRALVQLVLNATRHLLRERQKDESWTRVVVVAVGKRETAIYLKR